MSSQQRRNRRIQAAETQKNSSRAPRQIRQFEIQGPLTDGQRDIIDEHGAQSLAAYRALLYRLRFGQGAERLVQTGQDWRVSTPVPPTAWFVERGHFRGIRNVDLSDVEKVRMDLRVSPERNNPTSSAPYAGSVLTHLRKRTDGGFGLEVEYLFEHNALDRMERYTFRLPDEWHAYTRPTATDEWEEVPIGEGAAQ